MTDLKVLVIATDRAALRPFRSQILSPGELPDAGVDLIPAPTLEVTKRNLVPVHVVRVAGITILPPWRNLNAAYLTMVSSSLPLGIETVGRLRRTGSTAILGVLCFHAAVQTMVHSWSPWQSRAKLDSKLQIRSIIPHCSFQSRRCRD